MMVNPCSMCTALCCKNYLITVTSFDVLRAIENTGKKPEEFAALVSARIMNPYDDTILECYEGKERYDYLLAFKSHPCYFLGKNNECTIHAFAPLGCRLYPHNSGSKMMPRPLCPPVANLIFRLQNPDKKAKNYVGQMQAYKKIVSKWNYKHGKKEDCIDFLLEESKNTKMPL